MSTWNKYTTDKWKSAPNWPIAVTTVLTTCSCATQGGYTMHFSYIRISILHVYNKTFLPRCYFQKKHFACKWNARLSSSMQTCCVLWSRDVWTLCIDVNIWRAPSFRGKIRSFIGSCMRTPRTVYMNEGALRFANALPHTALKQKRQ